MEEIQEVFGVSSFLLKIEESKQEANSCVMFLGKTELHNDNGLYIFREVGSKVNDFKALIVKSVPYSKGKYFKDINSIGKIFRISDHLYEYDSAFDMHYVRIIKLQKNSKVSAVDLKENQKNLLVVKHLKYNKIDINEVIFNPALSIDGFTLTDMAITSSKKMSVFGNNNNNNNMKNRDNIVSDKYNLDPSDEIIDEKIDEIQGKSNVTNEIKSSKTVRMDYLMMYVQQIKYTRAARKPSYVIGSLCDSNGKPAAVAQIAVFGSTRNAFFRRRSFTTPGFYLFTNLNCKIFGRRFNLSFNNNYSCVWGMNIFTV